jgi:transcriptional regulator GlxA family with amidase domain
VEAHGREFRAFEHGPKCRKIVLSAIAKGSYIGCMTVARPKRIGVVLFEGTTALDVAGPMEAFAAAAMPGGFPGSRSCYELLTIGLTKKDVVAESGLILRPSTTFAECPQLDTLIIPGGRGLREARTNRTVANWIKARAGSTRRIASVCTGIYGLAPTGLLDGKTVTTHWRFAEDVARRFPAVKVDANALFLNDGYTYTSAGITAGIDLCLALIEEDYGRATALTVARDLVVFMKRPGGQEQYSEPLQFQIESTDSTAEVAAHIRSHLNRDLSVEALAKFACLSYRQFSRRFKAAFNSSPAAYVEAVRLDEARTRLCDIDQLAASVGFGSDDAFRRAFERRFGVSPSNYRTRFGVKQA